MRFQADQPNERWQTDITHWQLADGTPAEILNIIDDHSRLLTASAARLTYRAADVVTVFRAAAAAHGLPASMLSDNGAVFTGKPRGHGRVALEIDLAALRIASGTPAPTTRRPAAKSNGSTRHSRNGSPASPQPPPSPSSRPSSTPSPATTTTAPPPRPRPQNPRRRVRHPPQSRPSRADRRRPLPRPPRPRRHSGEITLRYNSRLHHIGVGRAHAGTPVLVLVADHDIRVIHREPANYCAPSP